MATKTSGTMRPTWQLLSGVCHSGPKAALTCEEWRALIDYCTESIARGTGSGAVEYATRRCLEFWIDCHEKCDDWLVEMGRRIRQDLEQDIADLRAGLADVKSRRRTHSMLSSSFVEIDRLEERLTSIQGYLMEQD